jgi:hypothetical protein
MTDHIGRIYFESLAKNEVDRIPYAQEVELWAPLGPRGLAEPIRGAATVRDFLQGVTPMIEDIEILNLFTDGEWQAGRALIRMKQPEGALLRVFDFFRVRDGRIVYQENHYDPRPVLG